MSGPNEEKILGSDADDDSGTTGSLPATAVALVFCGFFGMVIYGAIFTALTEFNTNRMSSGLALNNIIRNILSTTAAVATQPKINAFGIGRTTTMVGLFALITMLPCLAALGLKSAEWSVTMDRKLNNKDIQRSWQSSPHGLITPPWH